MRQTITLLLVSLSLLVSGQSDTARFRLSSFWINSGYTYTDFTITPTASQRSLAPGSDLLKNLDGYAYGFPTGSEPRIVTNDINVLAGFNIYSEKQQQYAPHWTFYSGFQFGKMRDAAMDYSNRYPAARYDTVYRTIYDANQNPMTDTIYRDTFSISSVNFTWKQNFFSVTTGVMFHTSEKKLFSFGIGCFIQPGLFLTGKTDISSSRSLNAKDTSITTRSRSWETINDYGITSEEHFKTSGFSLGVFFPLYAQFRFSRRTSLWGRFALTAALHPGFFFIPLKGAPHPFAMQTGPSVGIKYIFRMPSPKVKLGIAY
ncbi:MAG TPA: hypothetical protein VL651_02325 [Bacteroidia bacterium]|jgi:hypothetical protein|nr:hypothetical protein [Bacteroidia bacterium]